MWRALCGVRLAACLGVTFGLTACATWSPAPADVVTSGRFALTARGTGSDGSSRHESQSGRFTLSQAGVLTTLDLASPLGTTLARLQASPAGARLQVPDSGGLRDIVEPDAEALAERVLGFPLPLVGLPSWIRGEPLGARPSQPLDDTAADGFRQDGWVVRVEERFAAPHAPQPRRLTLVRAGTTVSPAITLRIVLDDPR